MHIPLRNKGEVLSQKIAGIYGIQNDSETEYYLLESKTNKKDSCDYYSKEESDILSLYLIGENVDLRYLMYEDPLIFEKNPFTTDEHPRHIPGYLAGQSDEYIREKSGGSEISIMMGQAILSKNYLAMLGDFSIVETQKSRNYLFFKKQQLLKFKKPANSIVSSIMEYNKIQFAA